MKGEMEERRGLEGGMEGAGRGNRQNRREDWRARRELKEKRDRRK